MSGTLQLVNNCSTVHQLKKIPVTETFWLLKPLQCYDKFNNVAIFHSLAEPDPYARGEGLVTSYTLSCSGALYRAAPIRLQLHCVAIVTCLHNIAHCH